MRSDTTGNSAKIAFDNRETGETPKTISGVTWAMVALLLLIVIVGALVAGGFFSSLTGPTGGSSGQPSSRTQP
jgi:hypothetical protein